MVNEIHVVISTVEKTEIRRINYLAEAHIVIKHGEASTQT